MRLAASLFPAALALLTGCGFAPHPAHTALALSGAVHGGQQPVSGATIQLYTVGTTGDTSTATPLLIASVTSDPFGNFNITADYTCNNATQVYLTATSGNPGLSANNPNLALMTALGACTSLTPTTFITVNELTTVAAVSALAPFMSSSPAVGASFFHVAALDAAFPLAAAYVNPSSGATPGLDVPAGYTVPSPLIDTLANIVATCVNSTGGAAGDGSACGRLFQLTTVNQVAPTDTIAALLAIARNPTTNNLQLYQLSPAVSPYQPTLPTTPLNFTVSLIAAGSIAVSSSQVIFPSTLVDTPAAGQTLTLTNTGTAAAGLLTPTLSGPNASEFSIQNGCPALLNPNASCALVLRVQPQATGTRQATLTVGASQQGGVAVALAALSLAPADLPPFSSTLSGSIVAAYDLTQAVAGQPIADVSGDPAKAIPWPTSNAPTVTSQGLVFDGATTSCLNPPSSITGVAAVSAFNTKFGEDYVDGLYETYHQYHVLFAGTAEPGNIYSAEKFGTGIGGSSYFHPLIFNYDFQAETLESGVGSHLFTFAPSGSAGDGLGIDGTYVSTYIRDASSASSLQPPYFIGCAQQGSEIARGTISYMVLWSAAPTASQLQATYSALQPLAQAHGINNDWLQPATATSEAVVCIGDSHTYGFGPGTYCSTANMPLLQAPYALHMMGTSGKFLSDMVPELPYELYKNVGANASKPITILDGGTNDILANSYAAGTYYTQYIAAAAAAHAAGSRFLQQTIFSLCIDNNGTSESAMRDTLNQWIRANWMTYADGISDVAADPTLGADNVSCNDTVNFDVSKYHLTQAGKALEGPTPQSAILNLDGSTASAPTLVSGSAPITSGQNYILANCAGACTLTLPAAYLNAGWQFTIASQGPGQVSILPAGQDTLNQQSAAILVPAGSQTTFTSVPNQSTAISGAAWTTP